MGGGLMQLVAYGAQDVYLTGNPQITFWKVTYRRHTNFAMESIEQTFNGQADFGRRVQCTISRNGDLAYRTYLQVTLPEIGQDNCCGEPGKEGVYARWLDYPGEQLISMVEVEIGGQRIDRQYGDWMHIWNQLTLTAEQERGYNKMVGQTTQLTYLIDPLFAAVDSACAAEDVPAAVCAPRNALPETTLYIPLQFWFCRNPGLALPLIALQYHEVRINLELRPSDEVLFAVNSLSNEAKSAEALEIARQQLAAGKEVDPKLSWKNKGHSVKDSASYQKSLVAASLYVDYIFLDTDERRRMAQNPHEYLIEQLQFTGDESVGSSSNKVKLNFNHPCKELIWVVQPDKNVDYCASFINGSDLNAALGAQPFNYTDALDALVNTIAAFSGPAGVYLDDEKKFNGNRAFIDGAGFQDAGADSLDVGVQWGAKATNMVWQIPQPKTDGSGFLPAKVEHADFSTAAATGSPDQGPDLGNPFPVQQIPDSGVSDAGAFVLAETALNMHCWGQNPVVTAKLQLNGQDRFSEREGTYFDLVQPYQHHTRSPDTGINLYAFALRPEEHQPSGTCNMSRIDNATLQLVLSTNAIGGDSTAKVRVYATNYNVLRVMSGMGGLAYSN